jgi:hypothetical protein
MRRRGGTSSQSEYQNVQPLKQYHEALQASDGDKMASLLAPDLQYWVSLGSDFSGCRADKD